MRILKTDPNAASVTAAALQETKLVIIPTDTIYGFSGVMGKTAHLIAQAKGRDEGKPFISLIASPADVYRYTDTVIPDYLYSCWPGPLTLILPFKKGGTQAFRCPGDGWLRSLIAETGEPLYSTSVNYAGQPPMHDIAAICTAFEQTVAVIVDAGQLNGEPSTIVDLTAVQPRLIRQGSLVVDIPQR